MNGIPVDTVDLSYQNEKAMFTELKRRALLRARALVREKFQEISDLQELSAVRCLYKQREFLATNDLEGAKVAYFDAEFNNIVDVFVNTNVTTNDIKHNILILGFPPKRNKQCWAKLSFAKHNIALTLRMIDGLSNLFSRTTQVRACLIENPKLMKDAFHQIKELEGFRDYVVTGMGKQHDFLDKKGTNNVLFNSSETAQAGLKDVHENGRSTRNAAFSAIKDRLGEITRLSKEFESDVQNHVLKCIDPSHDPVLLKTALEVMVLIDEYEQQSALGVECEIYHCIGGNSSTEGGTSTRFQSRTLDLLADALYEHIQCKFASSVFRAADEKKLPIDATVSAATDALVDWVVFGRDASRYFPQALNFNELYRKQFERVVVPQIKGKYSNIERLEVKDILRLVSWMGHCNTQISLLGSTTEEPNHDFALGITTLVAEYLDRVRVQVREWLMNAKERSANVIENADGLLVTHEPEDVLHLINMQVMVAKKHLPITSNWEQVLIVCLEELITMQSLAFKSLQNEWKSMDIEKICSLVNDSFRLYEACEDLEGCDVQSPSEDLKRTIDATCLGYLKLATSATEVLARSILEDVLQPIISHVFSARWEEREELIATTTATLEDYFTDTKRWIPSYFFSKCVRHCFDRVLQGYVHAVFAKDRRPFQDEARAGQILDTDRLQLLQFFGRDYAAELETAGPRGEHFVSTRLQLLESMAKILTANDLGQCGDDVEVLQRELGSSFVWPAIRHLVGLRGGNDTKKKRENEWDIAVNCLRESTTSTALRREDSSTCAPYDLSHLSTNQTNTRNNERVNSRNTTHISTPTGTGSRRNSVVAIRTTETKTNSIHGLSLSGESTSPIKAKAWNLATPKGLKWAMRSPTVPRTITTTTDTKWHQHTDQNAVALAAGVRLKLEF